VEEECLQLREADRSRQPRKTAAGGSIGCENSKARAKKQ